MNDTIEEDWAARSDYIRFTGTMLLVHSKNRKLELEKEIFKIKMKLVKNLSKKVE